MLKTLALTVAIGAISTMFVIDAGATPLAQAKQTITVSDGVTLVRDGCGRGMRWSNSRDRCVRAGGRDRDFNPIVPLIREFTRPRGCGPGRRWSNRRGRCVRD